MKVLSVLNLKGGVGKTTASVNIAAVLAQAGHLVLVGDVDSQGDASSMLHDQHETLPHSMADIFSASDVGTTEIICRTKEHENLLLIPADERLNEFDVSQGYTTSPHAHCLVDALSDLTFVSNSSSFTAGTPSLLERRSPSRRFNFRSVRVAVPPIPMNIVGAYFRKSERSTKRAGSGLAK